MALLLLLVVLSLSLHVSSLSISSALGSDYDWTPTKFTPAAQGIPVPSTGNNPHENITVLYGVPAQEDNQIMIQEEIQSQAQNSYYQPSAPENYQSYYQPQSNYLQDETSQNQQYWNQPVRANTIQTNLGLPDKLSDKTWNVPAPNIPPADNLIEDVSFNIGIILTVFTVCVIGLGATAGALTTKVNGGRTLGFVEEATDLVLQGIERIEQLYNNNN